MHMYGRRRAQVRAVQHRGPEPVQHRGPEQRVEINDVLADEMHHLRAGFRNRGGLDEIIETERSVSVLCVPEIAIVANDDK